MKKLVLVASLFLAPAVAQAQTGACPTATTVAVNPSGWVCITPGADYNTMHPEPPIAGTTSVPVVVRVDLLLFAPGVDTATGTPTQTINIGKPTLNAQGAIWVQRPEIAALPTGQVYKARAVSVGQPATAGGPAQVSGRSPESNPFTRAAPVPAPLAPTAVRVPE
jgi:hypothetical protein